MNSDRKGCRAADMSSSAECVHSRIHTLGAVAGEWREKNRAKIFANTVILNQVQCTGNSYFLPNLWF